MKRRILSGLWAAALCLGLCACGGGGAPRPFRPADDAQTLLQAPGLFSEPLTQVDQAAACALYGIEEDTVRECAVYASTGATAEELAIFALQSEEDAQTAARQLGYRVDDRWEAMADYLPGELPKLEKAVVETRGDTVLLVVAADYQAMEGLLEE